MNRFFLLLVVVSSFFFSHCSSGPEPIFSMEMEEDFVIPPGLNTFDTHYFYLRDVPTRIRTYLAGGITAEEIGSIEASRATLNARFLDIDWSIVREMVVRLIPADNPNISKEVFYQDRININGVNELQLFSSLSDVKDILLQDRVTIEIRLTFRRVTPVEIESRINMNFVVNGPE